MRDAAGSGVGPWYSPAAVSGIFRHQSNSFGERILEPQTFESHAPRGRLEQLSRCGSDLNGESANDLVANLAIGNSGDIDKVWANIALLCATLRPVSAQTIQSFTNELLPDICDRLKPLVARRLKGRMWVARNILYSEIALLALGRRHLDTVKQRAKVVNIRETVYSALERDITAIIHDRVENSAGNIRKEQWT